MSIQYKNSQGNFITVQQLDVLSDYFKAYYDDNNTLLKEERYYDNELMGLLYYNNNNENHQTIVNTNGSSGYKWVNILEYEIFSKFCIRCCKEKGSRLN